MNCWSYVKLHPSIGACNIAVTTAVVVYRLRLTVEKPIKIILLLLNTGRTKPTATYNYASCKKTKQCTVLTGKQVLLVSLLLLLTFPCLSRCIVGVLFCKRQSSKKQFFISPLLLHYKTFVQLGDEKIFSSFSFSKEIIKNLLLPYFLVVFQIITAIWMAWHGLVDPAR